MDCNPILKLDGVKKQDTDNKHNHERFENLTVGKFPNRFQPPQKQALIILFIP